VRTIPLRLRILLTLLVPLAVYAPVTVAIVYRAVSTAISEHVDARGVALASQLAAVTVDELLTGERYAAERRMVDVVSSQQDIAYAFVVGSNNAVVAHTFPDGFPLDLLAAHTAPRNGRAALHVQLGGREVHDLVAPVLGGVAGHVHVGVSTSSAVVTSREVLSRLSLVGVGVVLTGLFVTFALSSRVLRRIQRVEGAAQAIGEGNLNARVADPSQDEIGRLGTAFDHMAERLAAANADREKTFQKLAHSEKLWAVGRLAAGVAHEINNPLSGVLHCVEALQKNDRDEAKRRVYYGLVTDGVTRAQRVVRQLLEYSKEHELEAAEVHLGDLLPRVLGMLAPALEQARVQVDFESAAELPTIRADAHALEQVFLNLVLNAADAMPSGGEIEVSLRHAGDFVVVRVEDDGCGIGPESLGKIFDPFYTTKAGHGGSGLGLSVSLGIVERHGGRIEVESEPGEGTAFEVFLPVRGDESDAGSAEGAVAA
jgi:signal transduction histidine kinase